MLMYNGLYEQKTIDVFLRPYKRFMSNKKTEAEDKRRTSTDL